MYEVQVYVGGYEKDKRICLCTFVYVNKVYCTPCYYQDINIHATNGNIVIGLQCLVQDNSQIAVGQQGRLLLFTERKLISHGLQGVLHRGF